MQGGLEGQIPISHFHDEARCGTQTQPHTRKHSLTHNFRSLRVKEATHKLQSAIMIHPVVKTHELTIRFNDGGLPQ